jgi:hypothetical protein
LVPQGAAARVIVNRLAIFFQFLLRFSVSILKTVQNNLYTERVQSLDLVKYYNHPTIVGRIWNIERNDVQMHVRLFFVWEKARASRQSGAKIGYLRFYPAWEKFFTVPLVFSLAISIP